MHPATGFSVSRSLREAPAVAAAAAAALAAPGAGAREASAAVWAALWPGDARRQAAFHLFGMELLTQLDLSATNDFFRTFFALPPFYWRGFLGSSLSSGQLIVFALLTFAVAPVGIKAKLVTHLATGARGSDPPPPAARPAPRPSAAAAANFTPPHSLNFTPPAPPAARADPSGSYLAAKYLGDGSSSSSGGGSSGSSGSGGGATAAAAAGLLLALAQQLAAARTDA